MKKGMGRSAALLAMSSAASVILTFGPGLTAAHAFEDKDKCGDKQSEDWFGDDKADKDGEIKDDKVARAAIDDKDKVDGDKDKDDDWFADKDKDDDWFADKDKDCAVGGGTVIAGGAVGVGVGGGGAPVGGVGAGGGGVAGDSSPLLPIAGAGLGAILIGAGMRRRGHGSI
ncbi:hypothetical protein [Parafrankia elaeagni]|uniref:hypothetical protein n=1 Tax=Parafrankia elaeagni TaxID=222534 RepID=UPI0003A18215|nr:hypothetical protein [Parafrankia elaeagni]